jgi:hypothetical protein
MRLAAILLSAWLWVSPAYACPEEGAECRDDFDCGECFCIEGYCE